MYRSVTDIQMIEIYYLTSSNLYILDPGKTSGELQSKCLIDSLLDFFDRAVAIYFVQ